MTSRFAPEQLRALFDPRGVIVAGASAHPGKFGFVALHNILRCGYEGHVFATNLEGGSVLGIDTVRSVDEVPDGEADLAFVCTPAAANVALLKSCAARGVRAAFVTSAGYAEAGGDGERAQTRARRRGRGRGHPARRTERAGARVHPGAALRADRRPIPARGPHRPREPERQPGLGADEHGRGERSRDQPRHIGRERRDGVRRRLPRVVRRRRRDRGRPRLRRRDRRRPRVLRTDARRRERASPSCW